MGDHLHCQYELVKAEMARQLLASKAMFIREANGSTAITHSPLLAHGVVSSQLHPEIQPSSPTSEKFLTLFQSLVPV
jgi:hypothetical protein